MTADAVAGRTAAARKVMGRRYGRASLAAKLSFAFLGLVALVLVVNGALDSYLTYGQAKRAALEVESEKARAAAERVGVFLDEIQTELGWTAGVDWGYANLEQQRYDFIRLLRQAPAITALAYLDGKGAEQLAVSRLEPDAVGSAKDFSADPRFVRAVSDKIWFGPVEFRRGSEPYMTIALAHVGKTPGVTVADVNLKLVWDVVSAIHVGDKGFAYVVDDKGRLIAHPDLSLVLRDTDFSHLPQVAAALAGRGTSEAEVARSLDGTAVLTAHAIAPKTHWIVFVEQPQAEALATAYRSLLRSLALLGLGLALAAVSGVALARRMAAPIRLLQVGVERLGAGDLAQRLDIRTGDEIGALAGGFNRMAERLQESYETLEAKVEERTRDLGVALERQTATSDILRVISRSPTDARPVFESIVSAAARLLNCDMAFVMLVEGKFWRNAAAATPAGLTDVVLSDRLPVDPEANFPSRAIVDKAIVYLPDWSQIALPEHQRRVRDLYKFDASLHLPFLREGDCVGVLTLLSRRAHAFGPTDISQAEAFRDQALIAIENARLFNETQEALKQQTATADVLKVISRAVFDLDTVLQTLIDTAVQLTHGSRGTIFLRQGDLLVARAFHSNVPTELRAYLATTTWPLDGDSHMARAARERAVVHISDLSHSALASDKEVQKRASFGAGLWTPLMREGEVIGVFGVPRDEPVAFSTREIELVQTFADQAVIAIENSRLFGEVQAKTRDLETALERQTAMAEILEVISNSPTDARPVFDAISLTAARLFACRMAGVFRVIGDTLIPVTGASPGRLFREDELSPVLPVDPAANFASRAVVSKATVRCDYSAPGAPEHERYFQERYGVKSAVFLPLLRAQECIGVFHLVSDRDDAFNEADVALAESFRDQAMIAVENARLFNETREALAQQTATADVLKVISRSAFDLQSVSNTLLASAARLCEADRGVIYLRDGDLYRCHATFNHSREAVAFYEANPRRLDGGSLVPRVAKAGGAVVVEDILADPVFSFPGHSNVSPVRALLGVPLLREDRLEGVFSLSRDRPSKFSRRQIELVQTFADQALIAVENTRLFEEVQARTREVEQSLGDLRKTQDRLVQSEKLASLGQLTAGIAHEIKNPLNFVNNFAALSGELLGELDEALAPAALDEKTREEVAELTAMLRGNLEKVVQHGKRADSIVKNMLLHSREGSGEHRAVDLNALVEESVNLAYHGARAEKPGFNIRLEKLLDPSAGEADLYPQEITRVLLNLVTNGFYAATKRKTEDGAGGFEPMLSAATRSLGDRVEIRIRDNGTGIPEDVRQKMFNPFFTTKPAGEGTGLGLSLSYDIIVKQHGGAIEVETKPGQFTEFTVTLPRTRPIDEMKGPPE